MGAPTNETRRELNLDTLDDWILDLLRRNGRSSKKDIARELGTTEGTVRRHIASLEQRGVITGYTISIDHDKYDRSVEAYVEMSFEADADVHKILKDALKRAEVREAMTLAGDADALVRLRVKDLATLREAVMRLRTAEAVTGSTTRIVLGRHWHGASLHAGD